METKAFVLIISGFFPLQVYVSYDYGKTFKKISEKFSFGAGNTSKVAIAQFYHSPADNKRVRGEHVYVYIPGLFYVKKNIWLSLSWFS